MLSETPPASVGTQIVVAVIVGLLTAFAIQFLLTNLGLALGISLLKYRPPALSKQTAASSQSESESISVDISFVAGLGILITLNLVLFIACFLAVKFSTARDPISGATLGLVIWSTYFLILIWASYSAVGSVAGWVFGSVATKLRQLIKAIATLVSGTEEPASELLTETAVANLMQQEIQAALSEFDLQQRIDEYLKTTATKPQLDLSAVSQGFADLLAQLNLESFAETNLWQQIDRQTFITLINERTNLPDSEAEKVVERLESIWQQATEDYQKSDLNQELLQFLQSANPEELKFEQLANRLEHLLDKDGDRNTADESVERDRVDEVEIKENFSPVSSKSSLLDWKAIKNTLVKRVDLSDIELEDVWYTLQSLYQEVNLSQLNTEFTFNTISNDVEDYLSQASLWSLNCKRGWQQFKEVIYDPQADPAQIRSQLEQVQPQDLIQFLQQRNDLNTAKIDEIVEHLEAVRQEVFLSIDKAEFLARKQQLSQLIQEYLQQVELEELQESNLPSQLERLLIESDVSIEVLTEFLDSWQQLDWQSWLQQRQDLEPNQLKQIATRLSDIGDRLSKKVAAWQVQITSITKELQHKLESYLRYTNLDLLTPEKIKLKLEQLWHEAIKNLRATQASAFDAEVAPLPKQQLLPDIEFSEPIKILKKRQGIETGQVEQITTHIKTNWQQLNGLITPEITQLQTKSVELSEKLVDYLSQAIAKNLDRSELEADLMPLLNFTQDKTKIVVNRQLSQLDWNEIEAKLKQVQQSSEEQIQQTIKQARKVTYKLAKLPRRWAIRSYRQAQDLVEELQDFFSHSNKVEFDSEHLEHHLENIFQRSEQQSHDDRNATAENLDRLTANVNQSLAKRQDLSSVEIAQISDRFTAITDRLKTKQKQTSQSQLVRDLQDRLGEYFSSFDLIDFNRDRIKDSLANFDFQSLTDSWQETIAETPVEELGDRLAKISHETLSTIIDTNEVFRDSTKQQIQEIQDYIALQIETIKTTAYERTESFKQQTLQQVETTRKAIATATYWMFAITFTSAMASALAGFLASQL